MKRFARLLLPPLLMLAAIAAPAIAHEGAGHNKTVSVVSHSSEVARLRGTVEHADMLVLVADEGAPFCEVVRLEDAPADSMRGGTVDNVLAEFTDRVPMPYMDRGLYVLDVSKNASEAGPMRSDVDFAVRAYLNEFDRSVDAPTARLRC